MESDSEEKIIAEGVEMDLSHDEYKSHLESLQRKKSQLENELDTRIQNLEENIFEINPLSVIANLWLRNAVIDPDTYAEYEHEGSDAYTEYVTTVYLTQDFDLGERDPVEPIRPDELEEIQSLAEQIFTERLMLHGLKDVDPDDPQPPSTFDELRFRLLTHQTGVRYDSYPHHVEQTLNGILSPVNDLLENHLGYSSSAAITMSKAIQDIAEQQLSDILETGEEAIRDILEAVEGYEDDGTIPEDFEQQFLEHGSDVPADKRREWASKFMIPWVSTFIGFELLFTASDLADEAEVDLEEAEAFLERMSIHFGDVDPRWYEEPSATPPLQLQPVVKLRPEESPIPEEEERYFCPVPQSILWALRNNIEAALNPSGSQEHQHLRLETASEGTWDRYEGSRSDYTEDRALDLLSEMMVNATVHQNLRYEAPDQEGNINETEVDGLLLLDDSLFIVEVKAGALTPPARRGAPSLKGELDEIIGKGHKQALRAREYIENNANPTFRLNDGTEWTLPKDEVERTFMLVVSLEDLSVFGPNLHDLDQAGILADDDWPWCVDLTDLEVFAEIFDSPSEFIHFLEGRLDSASQGKIVAADELDWLGCYLEKGLGFELGEADWTLLDTTFTEDIDAYFMYEYGSREVAAPKPEQPLPTPLREIIEEVEYAQSNGFYKITEVLLDFPHEVRQQMAERMFDARTAAAGEGRRSGASILNPVDDSGVTYQVLPSGSGVDELEDILVAICELRKYMSKSDRWVGIGYVIDGSNQWVHRVFYSDAPWAKNPKMDKRLEEAPESIRRQLEQFEAYRQE